MILYIHGFGSCGDSNKTRILRGYFGDDALLAPDLPVDPDEAVLFLKTLMEQNEIQMLVGSSLGGYYADYLAETYGIRSVLINPSTKPYETLAAYVGINRRWCDNAPFEWKYDYLEALKKYATGEMKHAVPRLVLLQSADEVLDYRIAAKKYSDTEVVIEEGGSHRFENLGDYLEAIVLFYRREDDA